MSLSKSSLYGKTYLSAFDDIGVNYSNFIYVRALLPLEKEGYSEDGICYVIKQAKDKLLRFKGDERFFSILQNEVRKTAFKKNDSRRSERR